MTGPTQAVILAGGQGTRLRPLTYARPKPVVPLSNQPFLAYQLAHLRDHGVTDVILSCGYRVDDVRAALGDGERLGVCLRYVVEDEPLGTGGGVRNAADVTSGTVFVLNGDVLTDIDLTAMRRFHEAHGSRTTIYLTPVDDPRAYGLVETENDGRLLRFREKPGRDEPITTNMINAGVYLIDATLLARMPADRPVSIEREFFPALIADGIPAFGWHLPAYWRDIGSPAAYLAAQIDLLAGRVHTRVAPEGDARDGVRLHPTAECERGAVLEAPCVVGAGARLAAGSRVGPFAVLGDGVSVSRGASVEHAILWERVDVGADTVLRGCVLGADVKIGTGAHIEAGVVVESGGVVPAGSRLALAG
ncbi:MAG: NDP-sugar synthase [Candidatus Rokubacteria bacterium]|nr:NDP-sugar synthase [Candidatus Rokubacteria bacterium]